MQQEVFQKSINLYSRLNRIPLNRTVLLQVCLLTLICVLETYAIGIIASTIVIVKDLWSLSANQIGLLGTASTIGIVIGLVLSGRMIDRFGRKKVLLLGVFIFTFFTLITPLFADVYSLSLMRFIAGLGEGAVFPIPFVLIAEIVYSNRRMVVSGWIIAAMSISYAIPNLVGGWARNTFSLEFAWRIPFIIGGAFIILIPILYKLLQESPRWLILQGRMNEAEKIVIKMEQGSNIEADDEYIDNAIYKVESRPKVKASLGALFKPPYLNRTLTSYSPFIASMVVLYMLQVYGPVIFINKGIEESQALFYTGLLQLWVVFGNLFQGFLGDKIGRKPTIFIYSTMTAIGLLIFLYAQTSVFLVIGALVTWFFGIGSPILKTYIGEQYPTNLRGTGNAFGEASGRFLGGVLAAYYVPFILDIWGLEVVFWFTAIIVVLLSAPMYIFGKETAGQSIEQSSSLDEETDEDEINITQSNKVNTL